VGDDLTKSAIPWNPFSPLQIAPQSAYTLVKTVE